MRSRVSLLICWISFKFPTKVNLFNRTIRLISLDLVWNIIKSVSWMPLKSPLGNNFIIRLNWTLGSLHSSFIFIIIWVTWKTLKFSLTNFQLTNWFILRIFLHSSSNIIRVICWISFESSLWHNMILRKRNLFTSLANTFILIILPIACCPFEFSSNFEFAFMLNWVLPLSTIRNIIWRIYTLSLKSSFR